MIKQNMWNSLGKQVKVTCVDGQILEGKVSGWTSAADNVDDGKEEDSIDLQIKGISGLTCLFESEIKSIKVINS